MKRSLYQKLVEIEDHISTLEDDLGLPQRRNLLLRHSSLVSNQRVYTDTLILPKPFITNVPPRLIGLLIGQIEVSATDFLCEISRTYPFDLLVSADNQRATAIIDPPVDVANRIIYSNNATKKIEGGIVCRILSVRDEDPLIWRCILQREMDRKA